MQRATSSHAYAGRPFIGTRVLFPLPAPLGSSVSAWPVACADSGVLVSGAGLRRLAASPSCLLENSTCGPQASL